MIIVDALLEMFIKKCHRQCVILTLSMHVDERASIELLLMIFVAMVDVFVLLIRKSK